MSEPRNGTARRVSIDLDHPESAFVAGRLQAAGWEPTAADDWDLLWSLGEPELRFLVDRPPERRVNHLPGIGSLGSKGLLWRTVENHRELLARRGIEVEPVMPETFLMPEDWARFHLRVDEEADATWIQKPKNSARGEGVSVLEDPAAAEPGANWLLQRYLDRPHLIDGCKYTLRWFVAITDTDPLTAFVLDDGLAKFTSRPYADAPYDDRLAHLTNPDIQAKNPELANGPRKLTLQRYVNRLTEMEIDPEPLFAHVRKLLAFVVIAGREQLRHDRRDAGLRPDGTFELLGFDIMIDADLRPWLLEANVGPSLAVSEGDDQGNVEELAVKTRLIDSLIHVTGLGARPSESPAPPHASGFQPLLPDPDLRSLMTLPRRSEYPDVPALSVPESARVWPLGEGLVVQVSGDDLHVLNASASYVWSALREGLHHEDIVEELTTAVPEGAARLSADVWDATVTMVERGLLGPAPRPPERPVRVERTSTTRDPGRVYRYAGVAVGVRTTALDVSSTQGPAPDVLSWLDLALPGLDVPTATGIDAWVDVEPHRDGWAVRYEDALVPCPSIRQLGPAVRAAVVELGGRLTPAMCLCATVLRWGGVTVLLTGPAHRRGELLETWDGQPMTSLADDLVTLSEGGQVQGHAVGFERPRPDEWLGPLPGPDDPDPVSVTPFGRFVDYHRTPVTPGGPVRPDVLIHLVAQTGPGPCQVVPSTPLESIADLLGSRPVSARQVERDAASALVALVSGTPAHRVAGADAGDRRAALEQLVAGLDGRRQGLHSR